MTEFSDKALCSLAMNCERQTDYPALNWSVAIPGQKPPPQPPKPPSVSVSRCAAFMFLSFSTREQDKH